MRAIKRDGLAVEGGVLAGGGGAEVRLQGDVPEILEAQDAELVRMMQDARHRQRHFGEQACHRHEGHRVKVDRALVQRQHDRLRILQQHAEVAPIRRIAGERDHRVRVELLCREVLFEAWFHQKGDTIISCPRMTSEQSE